jgi:hypothetical protein
MGGRAPHLQKSGRDSPQTACVKSAGREERRVTNPYQPPSSVELVNPGSDRIRSLTNKSILFGVLGLVCCGLIFGPMAINYAGQAEAAIILDDSGANHGTGYKVGRMLGYTAVVLWALGTVLRIANLVSR